MNIQVRNVTKYFDTFRALDEVSLDIPDGERTALLGPSGCGKTTLLRIIAGLDVPDRGAIYFHGEDATPGTRANARSVSCSSTMQSAGVSRSPRAQ